MKHQHNERHQQADLPANLPALSLACLLTYLPAHWPSCPPSHPPCCLVSLQVRHLETSKESWATLGQVQRALPAELAKSLRPDYWPPATLPPVVLPCTAAPGEACTGPSSGRLAVEWVLAGVRGSPCVSYVHPLLHLQPNLTSTSITSSAPDLVRSSSPPLARHLQRPLHERCTPTCSRVCMPFFPSSSSPATHGGFAQRRGASGESCTLTQSSGESCKLTQSKLNASHSLPPCLFFTPPSPSPPCGI